MKVARALQPDTATNKESVVCGAWCVVCVVSALQPDTVTNKESVSGSKEKASND
jgi:hypothetical protein